MKRLLHLFLTLIIFVSQAKTQDIFGQKLNCEYNFGYGIYSLHDLKKYQLEIKNYDDAYSSIDFDNFPDYFYHEIIIDYSPNNKHFFGFNGTYRSTSAQNFVKEDGVLEWHDMLLNGFKFGANYKYIYNLASKFDVYGQLKTGMICSIFELTKFTGSNSSVLESNFKYKSNSIFIEPMLGIRYRIIKNVALNYKLGYEYNFDSRLKFDSSDNDVFLTHPSGEDVNLDWSGFRTSLGIVIILL